MNQILVDREDTELVNMGHIQTPQEPDDRSPTLTRQEELEEQSNRNTRLGNPPYANVEVRTRGEILWILGKREWSGERVNNHKERPNFSRILLRGVDLSGIILYESDFNHAQMREVTLKNAILGDSNFDGADLLGADLSGAYLGFAKLNRARLSRAVLNSATLGEAKLRGAELDNAKLLGANLTKADLREANLTEIQIDSTTILAYIKLDEHTRLGDISWNGVPLARVDWNQIPRIGDEEAVIKARKAHRNDIVVQACREASRAYRGLSINLRQQGLAIPASNYRLREQRLERFALRREKKWFSWFFSSILDLVAGYGERPARAVVAYLTTIFGFSVAFWVVSSQIPENLTPLESVLLSFSSFHGRGFLPNFTQLGDPIGVVATFEAVIGLFIELIFIATFSRRFLDS